MYSAPRRILAVTGVLISSFSGTVAFPQAVKFIRNAADPLPLAKSDPGRGPCTRPSGSEGYAHYPATAAGGEADSPCDTAPVIVSRVAACTPASLAPISCGQATDVVLERLAT